LKAKPFLIKPNLLEAQQALGNQIRNLKEIKNALFAFQKKGIAMALLSLADQGAAGIFKEELWLCRVPKVKMNIDVGCGDAFLGGFLSAFKRTCPFTEALQFAAACGTSNAQNIIPGQIDKGTVEALIKKVRLRKLA